jgi:WD40 repeat protein
MLARRASEGSVHRLDTVDSVEEKPMGPTQPKPARLLESFSMPVDASVFSGVPSVTALAHLAKANVLLAAAMDRRVVSIDLAASATEATPAKSPTGKGPAAAVRAGKHLAWSHDNWVHDLAVHPDGERVATGGCDRRVKIWKWGRDEPLAKFTAHDDWVRAVAFSPDGRLLASAGDDRVVRLWDADTGRAVATFDPHGSFLDTLAWTVDGKQLLAAGNDGRIHFWDVEQQKLLRSVDVENRRLIEDEPLNGGFSYPGGIRGLTCSPDGKLIAAVGLTSLVVLDSTSGKQVHKIDGRGFGVAFDPSSRWLAFSQEKDLLVWDFQTRAVSCRIPGDQLGVFGVCFLESSRRLTAGGCNGRVGIWELPA